MKKNTWSYRLLIASTALSIAIANALSDARAENKASENSKVAEPSPQLVLPLAMAEKHFYIAPMLVPENSTLEKTLDEAGLAKAQGKYDEARM
ncbi:MAG: hypothetical protein IT343_18890, partial [Candidatus Melainabacteria bacterium]|nr:hypothetical protein [Candidatus Melainabacteria bacterium]